MSDFTHGGDIFTAEQIYGDKILDFSANFNPLGMPPEVKDAAARAASEAEFYPDPFCRKLSKLIAKRDGVNSENILCGNGAADLVFRLVFAVMPKKALVLAPTFSEYSQALATIKCQIQEHKLIKDNNFELTYSILDEITEDLDLLFICNPNNPTGAIIEKKLMEAILDKCNAMKVILAVDECFLELTTDGEGLESRIYEYNNLFLLRAFTKSYCMAGLRLGYCITSSEELLTQIKNCSQPWSVSHPAQMAGIAAVRLEDYPKNARKIIEYERNWLMQELSSLGLEAFPSKANFILFQASRINDLKESMINRGILIRSCGNYSGLSQDYYRVAIRNREDNIKLINSLKEVL